MGLFTKTNSLTERAYQLWQKTDVNAPYEVSKEKIVNQLFIEIKSKRPWFSCFYFLFECQVSNWLKLKVDKALGAYKYDLLVACKDSSHLTLFSEKERWFIDQKLTGIFRNILLIKNTRNVKGKAKSWSQEVQRYSGEKEFMVGRYILHLITKKFPKFKNLIDKIAVLRASYIKAQSKILFENLGNGAFRQGIIKYIERPFNASNSLTRIFCEIGYFVAKEKIKKSAEWVYSSSVKKTLSAYQALRNHI